MQTTNLVGEPEGLAPRRNSFPEMNLGARGRSPLSNTTLHRVGALALALSLAACTAAPTAPTATPAAAPTQPSAQRQTAKVERLDLANSLTYSGEVRTSASLTLVPKTSGRVEKLYVDVGAPVKAGDPIAELDKSTAQLQVRQAEAGLAASKARLAQIEQGPRTEQVQQAEASARAAKHTADAAAGAARPESIAAAEAGLDSARQRTAALQNGRGEQVAAAEANVAAAQARLDAALKGATPERIRAQEIAIEQAKKALEGAWFQRDGVCSFGNSPQCDGAKAAVLSAEAAMRQQQQQLEILKSGTRPEQVAELEAAVETAKQQANLARQPGAAADVAGAAAGVRQAEAALAAARNPVVAGQVDAARAQADAAAAGAALATNPFTKEDIASARAAVDQSQAQVELARSSLKDLTITAPVDGVVSERQIVVGAVASPATPLVSLIGPELEIAFGVEESALSRVKPGQAVNITVASFPGQTFTGKVKVIAPTVDPRSRTAQVKVVADPSAAGKLKPGMFARVGLVTEQKVAALAIPTAALRPDGSVLVLQPDGSTRTATIQAGLRTADKVEVVTGLTEGDQVVVG
jgi:RND family efflux transporter MFP subunit